jgi:CSLREA domain-containing protein
MLFIAHQSGSLASNGLSAKVENKVSPFPGNKHSPLKTLWAALLIAATMLAAQPIQPAYAATLTVTSTADTIAADGFCTLREALQAANTNANVNECTGVAYGADTIDLTGVAGTITLTVVGGGDLDVTDAGGLTINGPGSGALTISGGGIDRVFDIAAGSGSTVINDLTIANGQVAGGSGGGILNLGNTTLNRVIVQNNTADFGGGIRNQATMQLTDVRVTGNNTNAAGSGAGISNRSAAANLTVNRSTIDNNGGAGNSAGGGINNSAGATLTMTNSTISGNTSSVGGGGILHPTAATMTLNDVTITNNTGAAGAGDGGGGLYLIAGGTYTITNQYHHFWE